MENERIENKNSEPVIEQLPQPEKPKSKGRFKFKKIGEKIKGREKKRTISKRTKTNIAASIAVGLIGCAVILNWMVFSKGTDTTSGPDGDSSKTEAKATDSENFFTESQIIRQRARDESMEVLQSIIYSEDALEDVKSEAWEDINNIARNIEAEANIESLVVSKGIEECVAVISQDAASVIVKADSLTNDQITQIQEIVYEQAQIPVENLKIIEK